MPSCKIVTTWTEVAVACIGRMLMWSATAVSGGSPPKRTEAAGTAEREVKANEPDRTIQVFVPSFAVSTPSRPAVAASCSSAAGSSGEKSFHSSGWGSSVGAARQMAEAV